MHRYPGRFQALTGIVTALLVTATAAWSETIDVPGDFDTLDEAVAGASAGDVIRVADGTYYPEVTITIPLTITSVNGAGTTILDGQLSHRVFDDVTADLTLVGFTVQNAGEGALSGYAYAGGALRARSSATIVVEDCVFTGCRAGKGGAIWSEGPLTVRRTTFDDCGSGYQFPGSGLEGGGVHVRAPTALIEDCRFINSRAYRGSGVFAFAELTAVRSDFADLWSNSSGGGIFHVGTGTQMLVVEDCHFEANHAGSGGGLSSNSSGLRTVRGCEFRENEGGQVGGGIAISLNGAVTIEDCTFVDNVALQQGGGGAFIYQVLEGVTVRDCYFRGNSADDLEDINAGGGALWLAENASGHGVDVQDCTFVENVAARGSVAMIQKLASGTEFPRFARCIFAYNQSFSGGSVYNIYSCGIPGTPGAPTASTSCSVFFSNSPSDQFCGTDVGDNAIIDPARIESPLFCDDNYDSICADSIASEIFCGPVGGLPMCGECLVPIEASSWGRIKSRYRSTGE